MLCVELAQCLGVEVVVVVVAYAYGVDVWEVIDGAGWWCEAYRPNHAVRSYALAPDGVDEEAHASFTRV